MAPVCSITETRATGPSSHGTEKTKWSLTDNTKKPSCAASLRVLDEVLPRVRMTAEVHQRKGDSEIHNFQASGPGDRSVPAVAEGRLRGGLAHVRAEVALRVASGTQK